MQDAQLKHLVNEKTTSTGDAVELVHVRIRRRSLQSASIVSIIRLEMMMGWYSVIVFMSYKLTRPTLIVTNTLLLCYVHQTIRLRLKKSETQSSI